LKGAKSKEFFQPIYACDIDYYSGLIFSYLKNNFNYNDPECTLSQENLLEWFSDALFCGPQHPVFKIPIIGVHNPQESHDFFESKHYHPVQLSIVAPLLIWVSFKYWEASMVLIGYWLKYFHIDLWDTCTVLN
jgi:hypothetical protein